MGGSYSGIEFAKIVMVALADVAKGLGLSFLDTEMVSNLTANLKAKYVTVEDFFEMSRIEAPKNVTKSDFLSQTWNP